MLYPDPEEFRRVGVRGKNKGRVVELSRILLEDGTNWDYQLVKDLCAKWGVTDPIVYKVRKYFYALYAQEIREHREHIRADFLRRLHKAQRDSDGTKGLSSLMALEAKVTGLYELPPQPQEATEDSQPLTEAEAVGILADQPEHLLKQALAAIEAKNASE